MQTLKKHGYLYDSTLIERWYTWNPTSPSADAMLLPYTMDHGIPQVLGGVACRGRAGRAVLGLGGAPMQADDVDEVPCGATSA